MGSLAVIILGGILLLNFAQSTVSESDTRILQLYNGTLTSITCSTTTPRFIINRIYTPQHYDQLPGLFEIEAIVAPDRSNVTLLVNGSTLAHNVTVECQNFIDPVTGQKESIFQLTLLLADPIPAPYNVEYNANDDVIRWGPPHAFTEEIFSNSDISVDLRITHYIIYVTDLQSGLQIANFTTTGLETNYYESILDAMSHVPCSMSIQVSAVNPAGEGQRSTSITKNKCSPDSVTLPEDTSTQERDTENNASTENVPAGGIVAVVIVLVFVVFIMVCLALLTVAWIFTRKRRVLKSTKSNANHDDPEQKVQLRSSSETSDTSESSQTKLLTPSSSPAVSPISKQPAIAQSLDHNDEMINKSSTHNMNEIQLQQCTHLQDGKPLIYAELQPQMVNKVSQPSSVEDTSYAVINHTDQTH